MRLMTYEPFRGDAVAARLALMDAVPETRYVAVGDADVAYWVMGDGPFDLLYFNGLGSHIDLLWDLPEVARFHRRLASISRLIVFDRRGTGVSDGVPRGAIPTWEEWTEDVRAVLDAVSAPRPAVFAAVDAGPIGILFAAMHPERVSALALANTSARYLAADDYPIGASPEMAESVVQAVGSLWGTADLLEIANPEAPDDTNYVRLATRLTRAAATPRTAAAQYRYIMTSVDVRQALALIRVPTLVLHNSANPLVPIDHGRYLAEHIPGARFVEVPGAGVNVSSKNAQRSFEVVAEFFTGEKPHIEIDHIFTNILFTDIVGSTERAAVLGDKRWRNLLDAHDAAVRKLLGRYRGREINTTGDGFVASFDGPARAIRCAQAIIETVSDLGLTVRAGLHTGECELRTNDLGGLAVHISARVCSLAAPGEVLVSRAVKDMVSGSDIAFEDRGEHELKGVPGTWKLSVAI